MATYDTIVVGMGAAGAAAAGRLARAGQRVLALEAQDRIGGRVHTVPLGDGVVELGAEWIHGTEGSPVFELARSAGVELLPQDLSFDVRFSDGSRERAALASELTHHMLSLVEGLPDGAGDTPRPLGQYLADKLREYLAEKHPAAAADAGFVASFLDFADLLIGNYEGCDSWLDVTTHSNYRELGGHQHMSWHRHGYSTLFDLLLNTYAGGAGLPTLEVRLRAEVTHIAWPQRADQLAEVHVRGGARYSARHVIVTLSLGVLKESHARLFAPPLPAGKARLVRSVAMGAVGKVVLVFEAAFWPAGVMFFPFVWRAAERRRLPRGARWPARVLGASSPRAAPAALALWTSGRAARRVETLPDEEVRRQLMAVIRKFMGAGRDIPEPVAMLRTRWHANPFTRGSYTFDDTRTPQHADARAALAEPLRDASGAPRLLFAGEATEPTYFSTVHGAVLSGYREASRLLQPASKM